MLTGDQVIDIVRGFLQKKKYRQAAQLIELFANRMTSNPDFFISLWNDQQIRNFEVKIIVIMSIGLLIAYQNLISREAMQQRRSNIPSSGTEVNI